MERAEEQRRQRREKESLRKAQHVAAQQQAERETRSKAEGGETRQEDPVLCGKALRAARYC